jgi:hypothetical protein
MNFYTSDSITYWLNFIAEKIKTDVESKKGNCKIQLAFTGNLIFIKGYTSLPDYNPSDIVDDVIEKNSKISDVLGKGAKNTLIYMSELTSLDTNSICHTYFNNPEGRPLINPNHNIESVLYVSEVPFGYSLDFKIPIYYGEYVAKDLLRFSKSSWVHMDFTPPEELKLNLNTIYQTKDVESCVLDIYDFDMISFKEIMKDYDFNMELNEPYSPKPWLQMSKLKEYIIF